MNAKRMLKVRKMVESHALQAYEEQRYTQKQMLMELHHLYAVMHWSSFLAQKRSLNVEIAAVIGLLHDIGRIQKDVNGRKHVLWGTKIAKKMLEKTGLFSETEIKVIRKAIRSHNLKQEVDALGYNELIKDADLLARYYENPNRFFGRAKLARLNILFMELFQPSGEAPSLHSLWNVKKWIPKGRETR